MFGEVTEGGTSSPGRLYLLNPEDDSIVDIADYFSYVGDNEITTLSDFSATLIGSKVYIFGGTTTPTTASNFLWTIDLETMTIERIDTTNLPAPRWGHAAYHTANKDGVFVFGGVDSTDYLNSAHLFNITTGVWETAFAGGTSEFIYTRGYFALGASDKGFYVIGGENKTEGVVHPVLDFGVIYLNDEDIPPFEVKTMIAEHYTLGIEGFYYPSMPVCFDEKRTCVVVATDSSTGFLKTYRVQHNESHPWIWQPVHSSVINIESYGSVLTRIQDQLVYLILPGYGEQTTTPKPIEDSTFFDKILVVSMLPTDHSVFDTVLGFNTTYKFYGRTVAEIKLSANADLRDLATEVESDKDDAVLSFFGYHQYDEDTPALTNDVFLVYVFENNDNIVPVVKVIPDIPEPRPAARKHHSSTVIGNKVYIFGGIGEDDEYFNDFWIFDIETLTFTEIVSEDEQVYPFPPPREGHSLTTVADKSAIVLHGGRDDETYFSEVWKYNITLGFWRAYEGDTLIPRAFHTVFTPTTNRMLTVAGGFNGSTEIDSIVEEYSSFIFFSLAQTTPITPPNANTPFALPDGSNRPLPNHIVAGIAGGLFVALLVVVIILSVVRRR